MITDDLDLMQLAGAGQKLTSLDGTDYLACHIVLAWPSGGVPSLFCAYTDWAQTLPARLAAKEQEIAELAAQLDRWAAETTAQTQRATAAERRVAELEAQLAERTIAPPPETPRQNQERMLRAQYDALGAPADPITCPDCGEGGWKSARALQMHRQWAHLGMQTPQQSKQFVEDLDWRCAAKGMQRRTRAQPA